jgi:hypothetical protein
MSAYEAIHLFSWVGYVTGGIVASVGVFHIIVGCCDSAFLKSQQTKMFVITIYITLFFLYRDSTATGYGWEAAPQISSSDFHPNKLGPQSRQNQFVYIFVCV